MAPIARSALIPVLAAAAFTCGCVSSDPFGVNRRVPARPSSHFRAPAGEAPAPVMQAPPPSLGEASLSLGQCVRIALENSPRLKRSWHGTRSAGAALGESRGLYLPRLELAADAERRQAQVITEVTDKFMRSSRSAGFTLRQMLLDGGGRRAEVDSAEAALLSAGFQHNSLLLDVALETEAAYYRLLAAQSLLDVAAKSLEHRTRHLELASTRLAAGKGRRVDVSQARAEAADAALSVVDARSEMRTRRGQLAVVMGLPVTTRLAIQDIPESARQAEARDVEELIKLAFRDRPRLKSAAAEIARLRHDLRAEQAARWPELTASAQYGWRGVHVLPEEGKEWAVGVGLRVPLFTGFQRSYRIAQGRAALQAALAEHEAQLREVEIEVWRAYSDVLRADEAVAAAGTFVESARENVEMVEKACEAGLATLVELIDAETVATRALNRRVTATLDWRLAVARLARAVGTSRPEGQETKQPEGLPDATPAGAAEPGDEAEAGGR